MHGIHVASENDDVRFLFRQTMSQGPNNIVSFYTFLFDDGEAKGRHEVVRQWNLVVEFLGGFHACGLVLVVNSVAEGWTFHIKSYGHVRRLDVFECFEQRRGKTVHRIHHRAILGRQRRQGMKTAVDNGVPVNQEDFGGRHKHSVQAVRMGRKRKIFTLAEPSSQWHQSPFGCWCASSPNSIAYPFLRTSAAPRCSPHWKGQ